GPEYVLPLFLAQQGYAVVSQDVRGRYDSPGTFNPFFQEFNDGNDTIVWCVAQPWSNGKVGTYGASYVGATQWLAAATQPPGLACMVPTVTGDDYYEGWTYQGGALQLGFIGSWSLHSLVLENLDYQEQHEGGHYSHLRDTLIEAADTLPRSLDHWPLEQFPPLNGNAKLAPYFYEWLRHPRDDDFWRKIRVRDFHSRITVPALNIGGWADIFINGTIKNYLGMRRHGGSPAARDGQRLIIGPWTHSQIAASHSGERYNGLAATEMVMDLLEEHTRWYDYWLKGIDNGYMDEPPVRIFVMGENEWRAEHEWPLARTQYVHYYLHSGGHANTLNGDGTLSTATPWEGEAPDRFVYDPADPVQTRGGALCCFDGLLPAGFMDQREIETRPDVLVYTSAPLDRDLEVTGPVTVTLHAVTDAPDTDFTAKLVDVHESGVALALTDGIIRARYRLGTDAARPVAPNEAHEYRIELLATSNLFKKGHRIRLEVSSSNFPRFDRNPNTGAEPAQATAVQPAHQTILHAPQYPSRVTLPVIPR
ncbi:MAG: CocE/NonD family hydrolase, partial [SAR202 cluster bacterium]|nr:CocE/NonD family hydrolase [SAR202 cluster bacterium]